MRCKRLAWFHASSAQGWPWEIRTKFSFLRFFMSPYIFMISLLRKKCSFWRFWLKCSSFWVKTYQTWNCRAFPICGGFAHLWEHVWIPRRKLGHITKPPARMTFLYIIQLHISFCPELKTCMCCMYTIITYTYNRQPMLRRCAYILSSFWGRIQSSYQIRASPPQAKATRQFHFLRVKVRPKQAYNIHSKKSLTKPLKMGGIWLRISGQLAAVLETCIQRQIIQ